ncbi:MAG TPA: hypothetical protein VGN69_02780 [Solirubrobacteraceae bacterium]|jgi:hypothetical protein|nr:hypothetical protein [Solirubrobacteraceae bacterium]
MSTPDQPGPSPSEEELRAAYEAELKRIRVADVVLQTAVTLINLAGRRLGLAPGAEEERDPDQARDAIDAVRSLLPVLERDPEIDLGPIRGALSQLQMAYAKERGSAAPEPGAPLASSGGEGEREAAAPPQPGRGEGAGPGPAQSSGRLWIPGQ